MKKIIVAFGGVVGGVVSVLIGGITNDIITLLAFMLTDYIIGLITCLVFKKSNKTRTGAYSSVIGFKGILKKCTMLLLVIIANRLDVTMDLHIVRDTVVIALIVNELISILENVIIIGVPVPTILRKCMDVLSDNVLRETNKKE